MLTIGYDAKRYFHNHSGLGSYSRNLVDQLAVQYPEHQYRLFAARAATARIPVPTADNVRVIGPQSALTQGLPAWWRTARLHAAIRTHGIDLFHGLSGELPTGIRKADCASVVTIHDLIFLRFPQFYKAIDRNIYRWKSQRACRNADHIVAISQQTRDDLVHFFRVPEAKISVCYQSCAPAFYTPSTDAQKRDIRKQHALPTDYMLYVGTVNERKNLALLLRAMARMRSSVAQLVVVGRGGTYLNEMKQLAKSAGLIARVHFRENVPDEALPAVYQMASLFLLPSMFEGFGIPLLEAQASGTPVVATDIPIFREVCAPEARFIDPKDPKALAGLLDDLLAQPATLEKMAAAGTAYAERFRPEACASEMMALYRRLV